MKELLAKIRMVERADAKSRCQVAQEVYLHVSIAIEDLSRNLEVMGTNLIAISDATCDELDGLLDELNELLNSDLQKLLKILRPRFEKNMHRHKNIAWEQVEQRLREVGPKKIWSLSEMERTAGEPDVVGLDEKTGELVFQDRSPESPTGRRNCVYDKDGEDQLMQNSSNQICNGNAVDMAVRMGVNLLDETEYREAQKVDKLDQNSWSWVKTPVDKRKKGVALDGSCGVDDVYVLEDAPADLNVRRAWRGSLRI